MIDIKKNPETVGKLKVGTSSATPADGEVVANVVKSVDGDDYIKIDADTGQVAMYRTGNYIDFLKASSTFKIRGPGYADFLTIDSSGNVDISTANAALTLGSSADNGSPSLKLCEKTESGEISNGFSFSVDGAGTNNLHIKRHKVSESGTDAMVIDRDSGLCTFSGGITVSGGLTSLGSFSELTIDSGGITVTNSTHKVDTQSDAASDNLDTITGGTDGSILILRSVTSTRDVVVTDTDNIQLATSTFTLGSYQDRLVLVKSGSYWNEISRSDNG